MGAKEYLEQIPKLELVINQKLAELETMKSPFSGMVSGEKVQSSKTSNNASFVVNSERIAKMQEDINKAIDNLITRKTVITNQIQQLADAQVVDVLYRRYVDGEEVESIASAMNLSTSRVYAIHTKGLADFETMWLSENCKKK